MNRRKIKAPSGILLIDKPEGITSSRVVQGVKRALGARKVGHAGTLDPFATGLLICCVNQATRLARFFLQGEKRYQATLRLGIETDTGDATGKVVQTVSGKTVSEACIRSVFQGFVGRIRQTPPTYSALKHRGRPLYRWAREGKPVQKPPRTVTIHRLTVLKVDFPWIRFEVFCSAGTYIRTLGVDVGRALGCGGHLSRLRRIQSSGFHVDEALPFERLSDPRVIDGLGERLIPMAAALKDWPELAVGDAVAEKLRHGRPVTDDDLGPGRVPLPGGGPSAWIKVIDGDGALLALLRRNGKGRYGYGGVFSP